ncbi:hypothetical protein [Blastopirellula marina]|uniref:Uncharacterized protein n=1 Tax=Blastopirellula marina TaxID=124 RepID=A0A2S8GTV9_9BACT|nr:hypothetical protein [Blastopirellula marina]PQO47840.1 hypothetical protein C5Y93_02010 [Blastopirellula marina]
MHSSTKSRATWAIIIVVEILALVAIGGYFVWSFLEDVRVYESHMTPGIISSEEFPLPLEQRLAELEASGLDLNGLAAYRVRGEWDMDQKTVCRLPYSADRVDIITDQLEMQPVESASWSAFLQETLPSGWWPADLSQTRAYESLRFTNGEEGDRYCLAHQKGEAVMFLYYDFNF